MTWVYVRDDPNVLKNLAAARELQLDPEHTLPGDVASIKIVWQDGNEDFLGPWQTAEAERVFQSIRSKLDAAALPKVSQVD